MGFLSDLNKNMPWNVYAEKKKAEELIKIGQEIGLFKDNKGERPDDTDMNPSDFELDVWDKMMNDGQVKAGLDMIKLSCSARGFTITGDDEATKQYADFVSYNFESIRGNMEDVIGEMLSALEYGFSVTEKVFDYDKNRKIVLKKLKTLDPHNLSLKVDQFGDLIFVKQSIGSKEIKIPAGNVILYSHDKRFGNPYGQSALRTTYKHWLIKDKLYRFANIAYERYGTPLLVGKVQDANDVDKMNALLRRINSMTSLSISGQDDVKAIQMSNADFIGYIEHHDRKIMESMLVPPMLLGIGRGQSGSYALTNNQFDVFMSRLEALQRDLKALIEEEIIRPLIDLNFPNVEKYPSFNFRPLANEDIQKLANVFMQMITAGVIDASEDWLREELGFPAMTEETRKAIEERQKAQQEALAGQNSKGADNEGEDGTDDSGGSQKDSKKGKK
ncbi:portal protein [Bacillus phage Anath]|uniref:Portal protein n=1 Tax=Bacillus phage Anath TaxID=2108114 RepID=A0A2P1JUJ8_9CAUD|nr:portal protein [Bacillus phage Anath]